MLISTNIKDEHNFMEWVEYHIHMADRLLVWDDESATPLSHKDPRVEVRRRHATKKEYMEWSLAYASDHQHDWTIHLDGDEYLYLGGRTFRDYVTGVSNPFVYIPWLIFGSNGLDTSGYGSVVSVYTRCAAKTNRSGKTLIRVSDVGSVASPHHYVLKDGTQTPRQCRPELPNAGTACIAHYQIQSWDHFRRRRSRNRDDTGAPRVFAFSLADPVPPPFFHLESNSMDFPHIARFMYSMPGK